MPASAPAPLDRPFDPTRCAHCDGDTVTACRACRRRMCHLHSLTMARRLCSACNADWQRGESRRNVLLLAIGAAIFMATLFALYLAIPAAGGNGLFIFIPVLTAAIAMRIADTVFRARFRRTGAIPPASMRR